MKKHLLVVALSFFITIFPFVQCVAQNAPAYKKAAAVAAGILGDYIGQNPTKESEDGGAVTYHALAQKDKAGNASRATLNIDMTVYSHKPHPHQNQLDFVRKLPEKWDFKLQYGQHSFERKMPASGLVRAKGHYALPAERSGVKELTTQAFVDFYAGDDKAGYFCVSINRALPAEKEGMAELEARGHALVVDDVEKIVAAIEAGLAGKMPSEQHKPDSPPAKSENIGHSEESGWLSLSPLEIIKTLHEKTGLKTTSPALIALEELGDFSGIRSVESLDKECLLCIAVPDSIIAFSAGSMAGNNCIMVNQRNENAVILTQLADGNLAFSPIMKAQKAFSLTCSILGADLPEMWLSFRGNLSPQEYMVLRSLASLHFLDKSVPEMPGFAIREIMFELGNPLHQVAIAMFPENTRTAFFGVGHNRNELAVALFSLVSRRLIKKARLPGKYLFALTARGKDLTDLISAGNSVLTVTKMQIPLKDPGTRPKAVVTQPAVIIMYNGVAALPMIFSASGDIFCPFSNGSGSRKVQPSLALEQIIENYF